MNKFKSQICSSIKSLCLLMMACAFTVGSPCSAEQKHGLLSFHSGKVEATFVNPEPKVWHEQAVEGITDSQQVAAYVLERVPLENSQGVSIKPAMVLTMWNAPENISKAEDIEKSQRAKYAPFKFNVMSRIKHGTQIKIKGTAFYDHNEHTIIIVLDFLDGVAMSAICDTYSDIYKLVESDFDEYSKHVGLHKNFLPL